MSKKRISDAKTGEQRMNITTRIIAAAALAAPAASLALEECTADMLAGVWRVEAPYQGASCVGTIAANSRRNASVLIECGDNTGGSVPHGSVRVSWDGSGLGCRARIDMHSASSTRDSGADAARVRWAYPFNDGTFDPYLPTVDTYEACELMGVHHAAQSGYRLASTEIVDGIRPSDGSSVIVQGAICVWMMDRGVSLPLSRVPMSTSATCQSLSGTNLPQDQCYGTQPDEWIDQSWSISAAGFVDENTVIIEDPEAAVRVANDPIVERWPFRAERISEAAVRPE